MDDIVAAQLFLEVRVDHFKHVVGFTFGDRHCSRVAGVFAVGGADDGQVVQVRNGEDDALVFVLQNMRVSALVQSRHDQVAALDQTNAVR
ncbi:hypothetical protein SRABI66_04310 [Stenotrophomonas lactitubi]|nr:hypothetical protein SRABI66_04310 [Stenotrophomonas lactitubi]